MRKLYLWRIEGWNCRIRRRVRGFFRPCMSSVTVRPGVDDHGRDGGVRKRLPFHVAVIYSPLFYLLFTIFYCSSFSLSRFATLVANLPWRKRERGFRCRKDDVQGHHAHLFRTKIPNKVCGKWKGATVRKAKTRKKKETRKKKRKRHDNSGKKHAIPLRRSGTPSGHCQSITVSPETSETCNQINSLLVNLTNRASALAATTGPSHPDFENCPRKKREKNYF